MKSSLLLAVTVLASATLTGCYSPQPTELVGTKKHDPISDWYLLPHDSKPFCSLPLGYQQALCMMWTKVEDDKIRYGKVTDETKSEIKKLDEYCNAAYPGTFDVVASNLTPDMNGQLETVDQRRINDSMVYDQNFRALADDWSRVWLMERPGGTPYNTVNTTGRF